MSNLRLLAAGLAALAAMAAPRPPSVLADRVFLGGRIWTGDPARPRAQALALAGDVIVAVGTDAEVRPYIGPATTTVSLRGRFVAPGFNDAHLHFLVVETIDLADAASVEEAQSRIRAYATAHPERPWVTGRGWVYGAFPGGLPHRRQLDAVVSRAGSPVRRPTPSTASSSATRRASPRAPSRSPRPASSAGRCRRPRTRSATPR